MPDEHDAHASRSECGRASDREGSLAGAPECRTAHGDDERLSVIHDGTQERAPRNLRPQESNATSDRAIESSALERARKCHA